jgi:hypothetical protein
VPPAAPGSPLINRQTWTWLDVPPPQDMSDGSDWTLAAPPTPGVVTLEAASGEAVLVSSGMDVRALVRRTLTTPEKGKTDYRAVTARVGWVTVGGGFERDIAWMIAARDRLPRLVDGVTDALASWWVRIKLDATHPKPEKVSSRELAGVDLDGTIAVLGPLGEKKAAGGMIDGLIDAFDLCRHHHLLVRAPDATACAYKEMGRCPAACDGSETLERYRARMGEAATFVQLGVDRGLAVRERAMREAANDLRFEEAEREKLFVERASKLKHGSMRWAASLARTAWVVATPSERAGHVRLMTLGSGGVRWVADVSEATLDDEALMATLERTAEGVRGVSVGPTEAGLLGVLGRWLYRPEKKRRGRDACEAVALPTEEAGWLPRLGRAALKAVEKRDEASEKHGTADRAMEVGG